MIALVHIKRTFIVLKNLHQETGNEDPDKRDYKKVKRKVISFKIQVWIIKYRPYMFSNLSLLYTTKF